MSFNIIVLMCVGPVWTRVGLDASVHSLHDGALRGMHTLCVTPQSLGLENVPKLGGRQAQMDTLLTEEARAAQTRGTARQHTTRV